MVALARRVLGTRRVGHAGTLDPLAEGVLPLAVGRCTRLVEQLADADKAYFAQVTLGVTTSTDDREGQVIATQPVLAFETGELLSVLAGFTGQIQQRPPAYSALKVAGQRAYALARAGAAVELDPRTVQVYRLQLCRWETPLLSLLVTCSKGTYVRALARDIGDRLGVGGHLQRLVRLAVGPFLLADAISPEELRHQAEDAVLQADFALHGLSAVVVAEAELEHLRHGRAIPANTPTSSARVRAYTPRGELAALVHGSNGCWQPELRFLD
jgi:tRNA pseudouridine55 synthase